MPSKDRKRKELLKVGTSKGQKKIEFAKKCKTGEHCQEVSFLKVFLCSDFAIRTVYF